jgi:hypothetical protein
MQCYAGPVHWNGFHSLHGAVSHSILLSKQPPSSPNGPVIQRRYLQIGDPRITDAASCVDAASNRHKTRLTPPGLNGLGGQIKTNSDIELFSDLSHHLRCRIPTVGSHRTRMTARSPQARFVTYPLSDRMERPSIISSSASFLLLYVLRLGSHIAPKELSLQGDQIRDQIRRFSLIWPYLVHRYQTPTGVVRGIQWVPADVTGILPPSPGPANQVSSTSSDPSVAFRWLIDDALLPGLPTTLATTVPTEPTAAKPTPSWG